MTLFNIEQYQKSYQRDWDGAIYDPAWDELDDITETPQTKVSAVVEVKSDEASDCWNPSHFGEVPRKVDANGNPTIFWDESIEPPLPDDFESNLEYEEAWQQWQNSDSLTCAAEWGQDLLSPDYSLENLNLSDSQKSMNTAAIAYSHSTQESTITEISSPLPLREDGDSSKVSISSPHRHPVSPSQFRESDLLPQTSETVFPQCSESLKTTNQNTSASKMLEDYSTVLLTQGAICHISDTSLKSFTAAGTMQNGCVYLAEPLPAPSIEEDYCWLPAPTALSTRGSRPPGLNKLETFLKKNELIKKGEVLNPVILSEWFGIPSTWLDPSESRTAAELLENNAAPPEISLTPELPRSPSRESCTSNLSSKNNSEYQEISENFLEESKYQFKVGDRVKVLNRNFGEFGVETEVLEIQSNNWVIVNSSKGIYHAEYLQLITPENFLEETRKSKKSKPAKKRRNKQGCLYKYLENKKLKDGRVASYPRITSDFRDPENPHHWRWGYNWDEKIDGEWKGRSIGSIPPGSVGMIENMRSRNIPIEEIISFIRKVKRKK
ncbi:hypothetical protein VB797_15365 [Rivularia sp. UHCC 0363]|nr:hypothetical protein [Rivularia sp. UHCC 0363]MEA5595726.1 hypothetical protein [Rivularia sp. UHCC 0363]